MGTSLVRGYSCVPGQLLNGPAFFSALERVHCSCAQSGPICGGCFKLERPEFQSKLCYVLAMYIRQLVSSFLCLNYVICKMRKIVMSNSLGCFED